MKLFKLYTSALLCLSSIAYYGQCANMDFEDGNTNSWTLTGDATLVSVGNDPYGLFPRSSPGGAFSVQLGNDVTDNLSTVSRTFAVTAANPLLKYSYAMVLLDFAHTQADAAKVSFELADQNGDPIPCTFYEVYAAPGGPGGFQASATQGAQAGSGTMFPVSYLPWTTAAVDLTAYIGQNVTLTMSNDWCRFNVDWGYAYVDAECADFELSEEPNCVANETTLVAPNGFDTYTWTGPGIVSGQGTNAIVANQTGNYNLQVVTNTGCIIDFPHTINNLPETQTADFNFVPPTCNDALTDPIQFTNASTEYSYGNTTYEYDFGDGTTAVGADVSHTYAATGTYDVTITMTHSDGCVETITKQITVVSRPNAVTFSTNEDVANNVNICEGSDHVFTDNSVAANGDALTGWSWDFGDGSPLDNTQNPTHRYVNPGTYTATLTVTTATGCTDSYSRPINLRDVPNIDFNVAPVCLGASTSDFINASNTSSGTITTWAWDFGDGNNDNVENPSHTYATAGTFPVTLTGTTNFGCFNSNTKNAVVYELPVASFNAADLTGCQNLCPAMGSTSTTQDGVITTFDWTFSDGTSFAGDNPSNCFENLDNINTAFFDVSLTVTTSNGCVATTTVPGFLEVYPKPLADFELSTTSTSFLNPSITATNTSLGNLINTWEIDEPVSSTYVTVDLDHTFPDTGNYPVTLMIENQYGCRDTAVDNVTVFPENLIFVPNTFTPDNDGKNDYFFPVMFDVDPNNYLFLVFSQNGEVIFQTDDIGKSWDGTEKGRAAKTDVYAWRITYRDSKGKKYDKIGHVTLLR